MATYLRMKDDLVSCPYNNAHRVKESRLQFHIIKCKQNNPEICLRVCDFNATHTFRPEDHQEHMAQCPDRLILDQSLALVEEFDTYKGCTDVPRFSSYASEESWEDEIQKNVESYHPPPLISEKKQGRNAINGNNFTYTSPPPTLIPNDCKSEPVEEERSKDLGIQIRQPKQSYKETMNFSVPAFGRGITSPCLDQPKSSIPLQNAMRSLSVGRAHLTSTYTMTSSKPIGRGRGITDNA